MISKNIPNIFDEMILSADYDSLLQKEKIALLKVAPSLVIARPITENGPEIEQLHKMMGACKLDAAQYQLLQLAEGERMAWHLIREQTKADKILLLGVHPLQLGVQALFQLNEVNRFDQAIWMPSLSLQDLMHNSALKKHLWTNVFQQVYF